jgi:dTDP-4-amino-4,6-dideoxygalactose transaminase
MVLTDDAELADKARSLRNLCFQADRRFYHENLGFNFRLTNLQAALGLAQLERMDEIVARKRTIGDEYTRRLRSIKGLQFAVTCGRTLGPQCLLDVRSGTVRRDKDGCPSLHQQIGSTWCRDTALLPRNA